MKNKQQDTKMLIEKYETLPDEQKKAVCWFIKNMDVAERLSKGEKIPKDEMKNLIEKALNKEDYIMLIRLLYKQQKDENSNEES